MSTPASSARIQRPGEQEALTAVAAKLSQLPRLSRGFDPFARHTQVEGRGKANDAAHDC